MRAIVVTGGAGQLATALAQARPDAVRVIGRPAFDYDDEATIASALDAAPAIVVNAAAWTAVDAAETAVEAAERANHTGPARLAALCRARGIPFVHVSTDYVFDGLKGAPYTEDDATNPTGVYGATKLAGERAVHAAHSDAVILRTSWVYARRGRNFVLTMLNAARRTNQLRVVADQVGCPTNADDLAAATLGVCDRLLDGASGNGGVYHAAGTGSTSWHGFARSIFQEAGRHGWPVPEVLPIATADWPTPARRPPNSRLDCSKLETVFGVKLPEWEPSLHAAVAAICHSAKAADSGHSAKAADSGHSAKAADSGASANAAGSGHSARAADSGD